MTKLTEKVFFFGVKQLNRFWSCVVIEKVKKMLAMHLFDKHLRLIAAGPWREWKAQEIVGSQLNRKF